MSFLRRLGTTLQRVLRPSAPPATPRRADRRVDEPGRSGATATTAVTPPGKKGLAVSYAPDADGEPDGGEIVWTWVPYEEADGRGKDRPVLVIGRQSADRVYAVRLTSTAHTGDADFVALGAGEWDSQRRPSWADVSQLYSVHHDGLRREASTLDRRAFTMVAAQLSRRYGWQVR